MAQSSAGARHEINNGEARKLNAKIGEKRNIAKRSEEIKWRRHQRYRHGVK